jgi:CHAT domain-containing protein
MRPLWLLLCAALFAVPALGQDGGGDPLPQLRQRAEATRGTPRELSVLTSLYTAERRAGNHARAAQVRQQIFEHPGPGDGARLTVHFHDASYLASNADFRAAREQWEAGTAILAQLDPQVPPLLNLGARYRARQDRALAAILCAEGRIADAQAALDRALASNAQDIRHFRQEIEKRLLQAERELATAEGERANLLNELITLHIAAGRIGAAELVVLDWIQSARAAGKARQLNSALKRHGDVLLAGARFSRALARFDEVLARQHEGGLDETSIPGIRTRRSRAQALMGLGRWAEAYAAFRDIEVATKHNRAAREVLRGGIDRALVRVMVDKPAEAERIIDGAVANNRSNYGPDHPATVLAEGMRGLVLARFGRDELALPLFRRYVESWGYLLSSADPVLEESAVLQLRHRAILEGYLALLARRGGKDAAALAEAFRVADALRAGHVQQAVTNAAARADIADPALAALVREDQDLGHAAASLYRALGEMGEASEPGSGEAATADIGQRLREIEARRAALQASIRDKHPDYAQLVRPTPPAPADIAAYLAPDEALLSITATASSTYVFSVTATGRVQIHVAAVGEAWLAERVRRMRTALDVGDTPLERLPAFDVAAAHELYATLLAPFRDAWSPARHLIVSASGSLAQIPFALLAERPDVPPAAVPAFGEYAQVAWLARRYAISHIPSAAALHALRRLPAAKGVRQPFVGFGDPDFGGTRPPGRGSLRSVRRSGDDRAGAEASLLTAYRALAPLPDTREEILTLARTLGATNGATFLGPAASRDNVLASGIRHKAIVAFATHGLQAGELPGLDQPALALALAKNPAASPLLTLTDVLGLKLEADWVVLSACNTASAEGEAAEALSGLGRGFFFAGARAILVTHWPVESESARRLVSGVFARYAADAKLARAEALRAAQLELMQGKGAGYSLAHPLFWAPYALIGDGGR